VAVIGAADDGPTARCTFGRTVGPDHRVTVGALRELVVGVHVSSAVLTGSPEDVPGVDDRSGCGGGVHGSIMRPAHTDSNPEKVPRQDYLLPRLWPWSDDAGMGRWQRAVILGLLAGAALISRASVDLTFR
jgi:hypothetical protein